jgi:patatin-like phospholipase/acyl hydrolase
VEPKAKLFSHTVIHSESKSEMLRRLHDDDKLARWFNIRHDDNHPKLCVYDRFGKLCDPSRSGNIATINQYPGFVSFIGKSGVGKSTLVKAMVLLGAINESGLLSKNSDDFSPADLEAFAKILSSPREVPVTKSDKIDDLTDPTTFGVHLYKDGQSGARSDGDAKFPIFFADCEGFYAGKALPNSERYAEQGSEGVRELQRNLLFEAEIQSPAYRTQDKVGVELFYARFLYAVSDVVVFVTDDDNLVQSSITSILEWAAAAVLNSINHPSRKSLIIVRHMANSRRPELYDDAFLQRLYLKPSPEVWKGSKVLEKFVADYNSKQDTRDCIYKNADLYRVLFSDISCCCIPNKNSVDCQPEELFRQYQHLRSKLDYASTQAQSLRQKGWTQYNVPALSSILVKAFEHFRLSDEAFDFYLAARKDNPTPRSFPDHIANFLRLALRSPLAASTVEKMIQQNIALSFVTWALRNFNHWVEPGDIFDRGEGRNEALSLEKILENAHKKFEVEHQQCNYLFTDGEPCVTRPAAGHTHHQSAKGRRTYGDFVPRHIYSPEWARAIRIQFVNYYRALVTDDGSLKQLTEKPPRSREGAHRERYLRMYSEQWGHIRSNKTCLACLQQVPENVLKCGHAYCALCVQVLGTESDEYESAWFMNHCSLCWASQDNPHLVRVKPKCAGTRILTLDGGGIRGVVELGLLKALDEKTGLGINIRDYFDLIIGTSTGGIIALALAMQEKSLNEMTETFVMFATDTFSRPTAGDVLTKMKIGHLMTKIFMALGITTTMFDPSPLRRGLVKFFGKDTRLFSMARERKHQCSTRVAVVAATEKGNTKCLIASYNRPDLSNGSDFEREDDDEMGMKIWEAALATSAAPLYLPPFKKLETAKEYVDGALYANCPAETALAEMKKLWTQNATSLDFLLSLGTGQQRKEIKIPKMVRIGGLAEMFRSFHNNLNTEKLWERFLQTGDAEAVKGRLHRLNPSINELGYVSIFHYGKMGPLLSLIDRQMTEPRWSEEVQGIADTLLANLFFFEPGDDNQGSLTTLSVEGTSSLKGSFALTGTIRSRLRHKSAELMSLLSKVLGFSYAVLHEQCRPHTTELPSNLRWREVEDFQRMRSEVQDNRRSFRVPVSFQGSKESGAPHVLAVRMKERPGRWIPISGFPVTLVELVRRANGGSSSC